MNNILNFFSQINFKEFNIQIAIAVFLVFLIFRGVFSQIILKIVNVITKNKEKVKDNKLYKLLHNFFIFLGLYLAVRMLSDSERVIGIANTCFKLICIVFIASGVNSFVSTDAKVFKRVFNYSKNDIVNNFICKVIRGAVWVITGYIILKELGYDLTGLVAGFGIGSVIISLAAQDTVKNLISGVAIMTDNTFALGDYIAVGNFEGTVIDISFRSTRIRARDNTIITIPNATIASEYVVNWNRLNSRKLEFVLSLTLDTTSQKIEDVIEKIKFVLRNSPDVLPDSVRVHLDEISSYSSDIRIFLYVNRTDYIEFLDVKEKILCEVLKLIKIENIELAYPTQTLFVENKDDVTEESQVD